MDKVELCFVFLESYTLVSGHFGLKGCLFKKPEEAECV